MSVRQNIKDHGNILKSFSAKIPAGEPETCIITRCKNIKMFTMSSNGSEKHQKVEKQENGLNPS